MRLVCGIFVILFALEVTLAFIHGGYETFLRNGVDAGSSKGSSLSDESKYPATYVDSQIDMSNGVGRHFNNLRGLG